MKAFLVKIRFVEVYRYVIISPSLRQAKRYAKRRLLPDLVERVEAEHVDFYDDDSAAKGLEDPRMSVKEVDKMITIGNGDDD